MMLVDVNLLLYAVNRDAALHTTARQWLEARLSGGEGLGLPWVVVLGFLRISTSARVFAHPLPGETATAYVDEWLRQPMVDTVAPGATHWSILRNLMRHSGTGGNLTTDAHIAALALEHGCVVCSTDNDFKRFPGLRHVNPLATPD
jgi:uncharacterized protein